MLDRLGDLGHNIVHHEFTDRRTIQSIAQEADMQRTLALRLDMMSNGIYRITREEEVADANRTDIRFLSVCGNHKAVAEVKLADKWSGRELTDALSDQVVEKYLRHDTCKAGCLLLTYAGGKSYWEHPVSGIPMQFGALVLHLKGVAAELEQKLGYSVKLGVVGIDLTDPSARSA